MFSTSHKFPKLKCVTQDDIPMQSEIQHFMQDDIPTQSEIQQHFGTSMAQVFFNYSHPEVAKLLHLSPVGLVQQSYNCTTQDNQLKTNASQNEWKRLEILKSHVHRDILALGKDLLTKFQTEIETTTQNALREESAEKGCTFESEKRLAVRRNAEEIHARYEEYFESAQQELKEKLDIEWANVNAKHSKELQKAVVRSRLDTTHDVLRRIRPEICHAVTFLYNDFELSKRAQRETIIADFNEIMRKQHIKLGERIKDIERKKMEELCTQRYELEIQNATDIIYVLCMERLRNNARMQAVHKYFNERIESLQEVIAKQDKDIHIMKEKIAEYCGNNTILQNKIITLTKEFQKFINFAFDAAPEHADFLLSLDLLLENDMNKEKSE